MPLTLNEFQTFKKLMARTTSPSDHEALLAIRRANVILEQHGATWPQVLDRVLKVELPFESMDDYE